ncbi:hypothetical protein [Mycobacterium sp. E2479]|uniref:hypothetical protein n=1 Tax=Mycobacterium sp. E2479 TaxID=1834134 RepID=UPI000A74A1EF|nr:hypothetical protein [Mycobacterium sp. E2479]
MTQTDDRPNSYAMNAEDQYRIERLYEETRSRLEEIALIGARVTGTALTGDIVRKFAPVAKTHSAPDVDVEIICGPSGTCGCIYRDDNGQWRWQYPCA